MAKALDDYRSTEYIDPRDLEEREDELSAIRDAWRETLPDPDDDDAAAREWPLQMPDEAAELATLEALHNEISYAYDNQETLIPDSEFEAYAEQFAGDIGAISSNAQWPLDHIDWKAAADDLKQDYSSVEIRGIDYWYHA